MKQGDRCCVLWGTEHSGAIVSKALHTSWWQEAEAWQLKGKHPSVRVGPINNTLLQGRGVALNTQQWHPGSLGGKEQTQSIQEQQQPPQPCTSRWLEGWTHMSPSFLFPFLLPHGKGSQVLPCPPFRGSCSWAIRCPHHPLDLSAVSIILNRNIPKCLRDKQIEGNESSSIVNNFNWSDSEQNN